jgi:hypothetical protein
MASIYSKPDLQRKINTIKDRLYTDGFYDSKIVLRYRAVTVVDDDPFQVNNTSTITDYIVDCIAEKNFEYVTYGKTVESYSGDLRVTVKNANIELMVEATEIWYDVEFNTDGTIKYVGTTDTFTKGTRYSIKSRKPSIMAYDEIFVLAEVGKENDEI